MKHIFLSHSSVDKGFVQMLNASFVGLGVETFLDEKDITVGQSIPEAIYEGIDNSSHLIYIISENSIVSKWVSEELSIAKMKEKSSEGFSILPLLLDDVELPTSVGHIKYADFTSWKNPSKYREAFLSILRALEISPRLIGASELKWFAKFHDEIGECYNWLNCTVNKIRGGLTAGQQTGVRDSHTTETKWAIDDGIMHTYVNKIISIIPEDLGQSSKLNSLKEKSHLIVDYLNREMSDKLSYQDYSKAVRLCGDLQLVLDIILQLKHELDVTLIAGVE